MSLLKRIESGMTTYQDKWMVIAGWVIALIAGVVIANVYEVLR